MAENKFDGIGFEKNDFNDKERQQIRHMLRDVGNNFIQISHQDLITIQILTPIRKSWWLISLIFGSAIFAVKQGFI